VPDDLYRVGEILGAVGLILPADGRLTLYGLIRKSAIGFHVTRREYSNIALTRLLALAAFVAYGRFAAAPL
jgi:hypothetical protein